MIEVPADNAILGPRNQAFLEWLAQAFGEIEDRNVVIRSATP